MHALVRGFGRASQRRVNVFPPLTPNYQYVCSLLRQRLWIILAYVS